MYFPNIKGSPHCEEPFYDIFFTYCILAAFLIIGYTRVNMTTPNAPCSRLPTIPPAAASIPACNPVLDVIPDKMHSYKK